ncbi:hypothetical protein ACGFRB_01415 [Streptomyces sp. NPDC048718]|uniref:hypothetical protein n=1 Tax=Streptomyces sp. NPDC048718 TaxID=3365587 RepID=UPI00371A324D
MTGVGNPWAPKPIASYFPGRGTLVEQTFYEGKGAGLEEGKAVGRAEGRAEGEAWGMAQAVVRILTGRRIDVPAVVLQYIHECTDIPRLQCWLDLAVTATRVEDLFDLGSEAEPEKAED